MLGGAALEAEGVACGIGGGGGVGEDGAEIEKMLLGGGTLFQFRLAPFGDEFLYGHHRDKLVQMRGKVNQEWRWFWDVCGRIIEPQRGARAGLMSLRILRFFAAILGIDHGRGAHATKNVPSKKQGEIEDDRVENRGGGENDSVKSR